MGGITQAERELAAAQERFAAMQQERHTHAEGRSRRGRYRQAGSEMDRHPGGTPAGRRDRRSLCTWKNACVNEWLARTMRSCVWPTLSAGAGRVCRSKPPHWHRFIFLGPTGVGKTELARALAEFLFDDEKSMVRIDMSEYMEKHAVSRLIGAPPGYVGYEEGGQLTEQVRRHAYSVVLFDEIEKAHPDVFNVLLQILDDGRLTDGQGRTVDFRNTVLVMTSNVGSTAIFELAGTEPARARKEAMEALRASFRPEFINRIDEIVIFNPLGKEQLARIVVLLLKDVEKLLSDRQITLELTPAATELLLSAGYDPAYGARPLRRTIQRLIQDSLAREILNGIILPGDHIRVDRDGKKDAMKFERVPAKKPAAAAKTS